MKVRLTQIDGKLPNLALMKLAHWHRAHGDEITFTHQAHRDLYEPAYDRVYGSAIFRFSHKKLARFLADFPGAIVGGTGTAEKCTVEDITGVYEHFDYSLYPAFTPSIGFTQRGCRLSCKFCVVPAKEGKNRSNSVIRDIWRGPGHAKQLHLLDNDFFGQPEAAWRQAIEDIRSDGFQVCLTQGINVRHLTPAAAAAIASIDYRDSKFNNRRVFTAWDNLKDEKMFFAGIDMLEAAGVPPSHVRSYMLLGYDKNETWERIHYRIGRMIDRKIEPFPMVFDCRDRDPEHYRALKRFQRWAINGQYRMFPFSDYNTRTLGRPPDERQMVLLA